VPALRQWLDGEYLRLESEGKSALVSCFVTFNEAYFRADYALALDSLPILTELADALDERLWQVVVRYYAASANLHWLGHLSTALDLTTQAVIESSHRRLNIPGLYARELMLYAWLETDRVGYSQAVGDVVGEMKGITLPGDLQARFQLVEAYALAALGDGARARSLALETLPHFDWPRPHREMLQAAALAWVGRWGDALRLYRSAANGFDREALTLDRNAALLAAADMMLAQAQYRDAAALVEEALPLIEPSINAAHLAEASRLLAESCLGQNDAAEATGYYDRALERLAGLGWRRTEAEIALRRLEVYRSLGMQSRPSEWYTACEETRRWLDQLRSTDLYTRLDAIESGRAA
jgi:tetratricopeptide (TPR) repeat protein